MVQFKVTGETKDSRSLHYEGEKQYCHKGCRCCTIEELMVSWFRKLVVGKTLILCNSLCSIANNRVLIRLELKKFNR